MIHQECKSVILRMILACHKVKPDDSSHRDRIALQPGLEALLNVDTHDSTPALPEGTGGTGAVV
jgi:hypothetical protein